MKYLLPAIIVLAFAAAAIYSAAFIVKETEQVVVLQFGEVVRLVDKPGLNFMVPFVQDAKRFDKRWLEWDGEPNQITTRDKRYIYIDVFGRWRIKDPLVFIEALRDETSALGRLDDIIDNAVRNVVANHKLIEVIRSTNRVFEYDEEDEISKTSADNDIIDNPKEVKVEEGDTEDKDDSAADDNSDSKVDSTQKATDKVDELNESSVTKRSKSSAEDNQSLSLDKELYAIEVGRENLTRLVLKNASAKAADLGIEIKDVQIKRINYIESVEVKVFDRMISERRRVAESYRSEGKGRSAEILGRTEMEMQQIQSEAYRESQKIMGRADAKAAEIYAEAYKKNPEFYQFTKTLESYQQTIDDNYLMILSTDGDYLGHLQSMKGKVVR